MSETENQEQQTATNQQTESAAPPSNLANEASQDQEEGGLNETITNMLNSAADDDSLKMQIDLVKQMMQRANALLSQSTADDLVMIAKTMEILGGKNSILKITQLLTQALKLIETDKTQALKLIETDKTQALKLIEAAQDESLSMSYALYSLFNSNNHGLTTV